MSEAERVADLFREKYKPISVISRSRVHWFWSQNTDDTQSWNAFLTELTKQRLWKPTEAETLPVTTKDGPAAYRDDPRATKELYVQRASVFGGALFLVACVIGFAVQVFTPPHTLPILGVALVVAIFGFWWWRRGVRARVQIGPTALVTDHADIPIADIAWVDVAFVGRPSKIVKADESEEWAVIVERSSGERVDVLRQLSEKKALAAAQTIEAQLFPAALDRA